MICLIFCEQNKNEIRDRMDISQTNYEPEFICHQYFTSAFNERHRSYSGVHNRKQTESFHQGHKMSRFLSTSPIIKKFQIRMSAHALPTNC